MFLDNFLKEKNWHEFQKNPKANIYAGENIWPFLIEGISDLYKIPFIVITSTFDKDLELMEDISCIGSREKYLNFPYLGEGIFFRNKPLNSQSLSDRLDALKKINSYDKNKKPFLIIASISSLINLMPKNFTESLSYFSFSKGKQYERETLLKNLTDLGYERVYKVYDKGEFSIRGDIIDIFDIAASDPVRLDFFDDNLEHLKYYNILTQESISDADELIVTPNFNPWKVPENKDNINKAYNKNSAEEYISLIDLLKEKIRNFGVIICDPLEVYLKLKSEIDIIKKSISPEKNNLITEDADIIKKYIPSKDFLDDLNTNLKFYLYSSKKALIDENDFEFNEINIQKQNFGNPGAFIENIKNDMIKNKKILISLDNKERMKKICNLITEAGITFNLLKNDKNINLSEIKNKIINISDLNLLRGYKSCIFSIYGELDIFEQLDSSKKTTLKILPKGFNEFKPGDYVVHKTHGIGKYINIVSENISGIKKDFFLIEYAGKDKLYVPIWQAERIHKYVGDSEPVITSLNSKQWNNLKTRVRKSVKVLAVNLAKLYAEREKLEGYSFPPDSPWQKEIEDLFPFNETEDQLKAINYVKSKMEEPKPMDILLCGDVGFGKTEVAIRAVFKAMECGKQVLMLVPTTILADQHFNNFKARFQNYPLNVEVLSRFKTKSKQKEIVRDFSEGKVDMLIGTHRILQDDIKPKDIGLLVVDEEQRFGVNAKEKLKLLRKEIDVLTLTATPIPRTLYMSLTGIRDIILIETYPENRHPVKTFVGRKNNMIIEMAIKREMERGGQIYYVSSRINGIDQLCFELKKLVPQASIAVTHGRMEGCRIEKIMEDFINKKYNILLTTTIIESGMDIPNVNTLIVEDAQRFGLSQLYQLRGRVGRSSERAYAYFFYNERDSLTLNALERLKALNEYTELGSGYNIAMKDLEIRGAGDLLGANQHGHMNSIGFDLYCEIIREEIERLRGSEPAEDFSVSIELPVSAYIPKTFIKNEGERINIYKNLANAGSIEEIINVKKKILEKFGDIPAVFENLINIAKIKILLKSKNIRKINYKRNKGVIIKPVVLSTKNAIKVNKKNKNIIYNFKDKSFIINVLNSNIRLDIISEIINDIISII
ncbi:MAG: transcription-repair coupling factor [Actinobacteria bacterium]|nr:transcription-repair coupling factor [Actinomycetota bacterium]